MNGVFGVEGEVGKLSICHVDERSREVVEVVKQRYLHEPVDIKVHACDTLRSWKFVVSATRQVRTAVYLGWAVVFAAAPAPAGVLSSACRGHSQCPTGFPAPSFPSRSTTDKPTVYRRCRLSTQRASHSTANSLQPSRSTSTSTPSPCIIATSSTIKPDSNYEADTCLKKFRPLN